MENNTHDYNNDITSLFAPQDHAFSETITEMKREDNVSATEGKLLQVLAQG